VKRGQVNTPLVGRNVVSGGAGSFHEPGGQHTGGMIILLLNLLAQTFRP
jgi:hypothetical protein